MKKISTALIAMSIVLFAGTAIAQTSKEQRKERQELAKSTKQELNDKASKAALKEAKKLTKEGWKVAPGALPLERQLDKSYLLQYQYDDDFLPKYIMAEAKSVGSNYDAAKMQALELSKQNLAGQIQTEITALIENTVSNEQLEAGAAESVTRSVMASKNLIAQSIGRVIPVTEAYMVDKKTGNHTVLVRIAYSTDMAKTATKKAIKKDLEAKGDSLHNQLDKLLGW